jgi:hypothetical protein
LAGNNPALRWEYQPSLRISVKNCQGRQYGPLSHVKLGHLDFRLTEQFLMSAYSRFLSRGILLSTIAILMPAAPSYAHHSYAPYDIRSPVQIAGVAEDFVYRRPHPKLTLVDEEGVSWEIEVPIRRWERAELAPDAIKPGDQLLVRVFPARNRSPKAAMSGFEKDGAYYSVTEEIRQRSGNEAADAIESGETLEEVLERYPDPE